MLMKKLLLYIGVAILAVGVGAATAGHYANYQNKQAKPVPTISVAQANKEVADAQKAVTEASGVIKSLTAQYNAQVAECQKGKVAYDKLTPFVKTQTPAPTCAAPIQ